MCLIALAYKISKDYPLILIANRDEFFDRDSREIHWWDEGILAGRDLKAGGAWLGINKQGRIAAVTNYRDLNRALKEGGESRGGLTSSFLKSEIPVEQYLNDLIIEDNHRGYNLILGDLEDLYHYSNISREITRIESGVHAVSNALLDTKWPKTELAKERLEALLTADNVNISFDNLYSILQDSKLAADSDLPETGLELEVERVLSSIFINQTEFKERLYGTRCSTIIMISQQGRVEVQEVIFNEKEPRSVQVGFDIEAA